MPTRSLIFLMMLACLLMLGFSADVSTDTYIGYAYQEGTERLIYKEEFTDRFENGKHVETITNYFDPSNKLIAKRLMDFSRSNYAPDFQTEDMRSGYLEGAEVKGNVVRLFVKNDKNSILRENLVTVPEPMVIDGGFNRFIKAHWQELLAGDALVFHFTVSSSLDYFTLRATRTKLSAKEMVIKIEPDKAILRWLASPIIIHYDLNTKRILCYEGKSNIADDKGSNFIIKLMYPEKGP